MTGEESIIIQWWDRNSSMSSEALRAWLTSSLYFISCRLYNPCTTVMKTTESQRSLSLILGLQPGIALVLKKKHRKSVPYGERLRVHTALYHLNAGG